MMMTEVDKERKKKQKRKGRKEIVADCRGEAKVMIKLKDGENKDASE